MKKLKSLAKGTVKTFANFPLWIGFDAVKNSTNFVCKAVDVILRRNKTLPQESFAEAMKRLNLNDSDMDQRKYRYLNACLIYLVFAFGMLCYLVYLFFAKYVVIDAIIVTLILSITFSSLAFYNYFWYFQIKHKKLGCTVREVLANKINEVN